MESALNGNRASKLAQSRTKQHIQLIKIDKKYSLLNPISQRQLTTELQSELDYLLTRKEKENQKKKRIKELEDIYEKERANRINKLNSKIVRSDSNREQGLSLITALAKKSNDRFQKIKKKQQHDNEEQIQHRLQLRKDYDGASQSSKSSLSQDRDHKNARSFSHNLQLSNKDIDSAIRLIESRIDTAKTKNQFYKLQIAQKARGYSRNYEEVIEQIRSKSVIDEASCFQEYYHRATHILQCKQKSRSFYEQQSEKKKKIIQEKFKKCTENLEHLDKERESKYLKLNNKFDRTAQAKTWKNQKNAVYLKKFIQNQKGLQQQKLTRAETILKKHFELRLKNKALKQHKDKIIQTLKKVEP